MSTNQQGQVANKPNAGAKQGGETALATIGARFVAEVERQWIAQMGSPLKWTDYEKTLAQHLCLKVDAQLNALEAKRLETKRDGLPYTWDNINLKKLALDGAHRINLGLDALIPNHIHPIPYWNRRLGKYDVDLRIGYVGKLFCRTELAVERPVEVICELVYSTDTFIPYVRSRDNEIESYEFKINNPFDRGEVIGGFGYIVYQDPKKNRLIIITKRDFDRAERSAQTKDFWAEDKSRLEMMYKTVVHRVADKIPLDPRKVNAPSYAYIESQEAERDAEEAAANANQGPVIDVEPVEHEEQATAQAEPQKPTEPQKPAEAPKPEPKGTPQAKASSRAQGTLTEGPGY